jgi:phasin family protein
MSTTQMDKSSSKSRQRKRKADQRGQKTDREQSPNLDREYQDQTSTAVALTDAVATGEAAVAELPSHELLTPADVPLAGEAARADAPSINPGAAADNDSIGIQTIANAYGDYAKKSFQQTESLVAKLMGARSFDKAMEVQTEFARQAYANLVAESRNLLELHSRLARQIFTSWQRFAVGARSK